MAKGTTHVCNGNTGVSYGNLYGTVTIQSGAITTGTDDCSSYKLQNMMIGPAWTYGAAPKPDMTVKKGSASFLEYSPQQQAQLGVTATGAPALKQLQVGEIVIPIAIAAGTAAARPIGTAIGNEVVIGAKKVYHHFRPEQTQLRVNATGAPALQNLKQGCPECLTPGFPFNSMI